jgi:hypothetical protein
MDNGDAQVQHQKAVNAIEKTKYDAYTKARQAYYDAVNEANAGYAKDMAQPLADLQTAKAQAQQTYLDTVADAGKVMADAKAAAELAYDTALTTAKKTLVDALSAADKALADTVDAAAQARDGKIADAEQTRDDALADAEQAWKDAREAAAVAEERANVSAYSAYLGAVVAAGVALDGAVTAADVTEEEADAAAGVAWTDAVAAAWDAEVDAEADAADQWYDATTAADTAALDAAEGDIEAWNTAAVSAWQAEVDAILPAFGAAVHAWAGQAGTRFAHLLDTEASAWISAVTGDVAAAVADEEAVFDAEVTKVVTEFEAADEAEDAEVADLDNAAEAEADAVVTDVEDEARAALDEVTAVDEAWQADEAEATADAAARDNDVTEAAVTDANADQDAEAAWEAEEAAAADTDQKAVDAADAKADHAQADAAKAGNDKVTDAKKARDDKDAKAAQERDTKVAAAHHDAVEKKADAVDAAVVAAAAEAERAVNAEAQAAPPAIIAAADAAVAEARAKNADSVAKSIAVADRQRAALVEKVRAQAYDAIVAAQRQQDQDAAAPITDPRFAQANPPPPDGTWQIIYDALPSWKTVAIVGIGAAALLIPGAGPVVFAVGLGLLAAQGAASAYDRRFNQGQGWGTALGGAAADATGLTTVYAGITDKDLASGRHLGLTDAQRREMITEGGLQVGLLAYGGARAGRTFLRGRPAEAGAPPAEPTTPGAKPVTPEPAQPPPKATAGSDAGRAGAAEQAQTMTPCFPAGTPIRTPTGWKPIEDVQVWDVVLSKPEDGPGADVAIKQVREVFTRVSPVLNLHAGGRVIRVTPEHPFWAAGRGWVPAVLLRIGDVLLTSDNRPVPVEGVAESGEVVTVYNFHVADWHTYFVGRPDWGFDAWTHNSTGHPTSGQPAPKGPPATTEASVADKLERYLLNPDHPVGGPKAKWFQEALGFTKENAADLAKQIKFDETAATITGVTEHGTKFNQAIRITGANGRIIDVIFAWIKNTDGVVRLVTGIPTPK